VCEQCGKPAHFRNASKRSRACFASTPHAKDCNLKTRTFTSRDFDEHKGIVVITKSIFTTCENQLGITTMESDNGTAGQTVTGQSNNVISPKLLTIGGLLSRLVSNPVFQHLNAPISIKGHHFKSIEGLFFELSKTSRDQVGKWHGYWGKVSRARSMDSGVWLDTGSYYEPYPSIRLPHPVANRVLDHFNVQHTDLVGANFLAFGKLKETSAFFCTVEDLSLFTIQLKNR
jgi:hypothetical protein